LYFGFQRRALQCLRKALIFQSPHFKVNIAYPVSHNTNDELYLSIIIPTYNRADSLARTLKSLIKQTLPSSCFEIIVVNNSCSDHTQEICARYAPRFRNFTVIKESISGLLAARHAGWRAASADILTFCDDDIEALPVWAETIVSVCQEIPDLSLLGGNNYPCFAPPPPVWMNSLWSEYAGIRWNVYYSLIEGVENFQEAPLPTLVFGCNYTIRRRALETAGGFEPDLMPNVLFQGGGETGIISSIVSRGGKVFLHPKVSIKHHMPASRLTYDYMYKRGVCIGIERYYSYLRSGKGKPPRIITFDKFINPALEKFYRGQQWAHNIYTQAVFTSPALRSWIIRESYYGEEQPPLQALIECQCLAERFGW
jgi:glycosyltransferase involved in cell wall biosynthesis